MDQRALLSSLKSLILHSNLMTSKVIDIVRPRKKQSGEMQFLRRNAMISFADVARNGGRQLATLIKIASKELVPALRVVANQYRNIPVPIEDHSNKIRDGQGRWIDAFSITSKKLREILFCKDYASPKIAVFDEDMKQSYFYNLSKTISTGNKSRMLRLLHGDVYTAERLVRFGLSEIDRCRRCFQKETIDHLLIECPYSQAVYDILRIRYEEKLEVLGVGLNKESMEIRFDILNYLLFKQKLIPPEILVRSIIEKYAKGLGNKVKLKRVAEWLLNSLD
jgi:hypothetical protein